MVDKKEFDKIAAIGVTGVILYSALVRGSEEPVGFGASGGFGGLGGGESLGLGNGGSGGGESSLTRDTGLTINFPEMPQPSIFSQPSIIDSQIVGSATPVSKKEMIGSVYDTAGAQSFIKSIGGKVETFKPVKDYGASALGKTPSGTSLFQDPMKTLSMQREKTTAQPLAKDYGAGAFLKDTSGGSIFGDPMQKLREQGGANVPTSSSGDRKVVTSKKEATTKYYIESGQTKYKDASGKTHIVAKRTK